jgi:diphthine-ammonia ligase
LEAAVKAFISWSGGKDTSLAFYKVRQNQDVQISCLLNMVSPDGQRSRTHGVSSGLLRLQAEALGVPIIQRRASWANYEQEFKKAVLDLKKEDIRSGVFGDIDLAGHRKWVAGVCKESGIKPIFPLWQRKRKNLLREFINAGFQASVVCVQSPFLGKEWLGRSINEEFIDDISSLENIDICGEKGEYHSFVFNGPVFEKRIKLLSAKKTKRGQYWFLDILNYEITKKR